MWLHVAAVIYLFIVQEKKKKIKKKEILNQEK